MSMSMHRPCGKVLAHVQVGLSCTGSISFGACGAYRTLVIIELIILAMGAMGDAEDGAPQQRQHGSLQPPRNLAAPGSLRHGRPVVGKPVLLRL